MLDGQGCLLLARHFHPEGSPLLLSSWSGRYTTCRAEGSAETNRNPHSESPCSSAAQVEGGELLDFNIFWTCHCSSVRFIEADATQTWDSNGQLAEEGTIPCISSQFDYSSTSPMGSALVLPLLSFKGVKEDGKLELVGISHCIFSEFGSTSSEFSRSVQEEGTFGKFLGGNGMLMEFAEAASSRMISEEEGLSRSEGGVRDIEEGKRTTTFLHNWEDAEASDIKERDTGVEDSGMLQKISRFKDNNEKFLGLACAEEICTKLTEESCSEPASMEKIPIRHSSFERSATQGDSFECSCGKGCKKLTILSCLDTLPGNTQLYANREMASSSVDDQTSQQQPYLPGLDIESALRCLAFVHLSDLGRLSRVCRRYRDLVTSRLILKLRQTYGTVEHLVFKYTSPPGDWTAYDASRNVWRTLPPANADPSFDLSDRESLSAGSHLLWVGKEMFDFVYYRYDLLTNSWERGPSMINPRCLFASASCGEFAFVAGGFGPADNSGALTLLNSAERYNSLTGEWERLPPMSSPRHKSSGFFMDGKFYVIGGRDANHQPIMSGEEYNPSTGVWRTIPNMYFAPEIDRRDIYEPSPPLVAAVNNQLYAVENSTNTFKIYNKHNNTWSNLGNLPVPADFRNGWGVAFKAFGDRLFVMGVRDGISAFCWRPGPNATWELLPHGQMGVNSFLYNCAVMTC